MGILRRRDQVGQRVLRRLTLPGLQQRLRRLRLHVDVAHNLSQAVVQIAGQTLAFFEGCQRALLFDEQFLCLFAFDDFVAQTGVGVIQGGSTQGHALFQCVDQIAYLCGHGVEHPREHADFV